MKWPALTILAAFALCALAVAQAPEPSPYEVDDGFKPLNQIDVLVLAAQKKKGIEPAKLCSDAVFLRRAYMDVIGTMPKPQEVRDFLADTSPGKRAALIESLMMRPEFADYRALKWGDLLRIKSEFPINLWPNAVQAYHRWVLEAVRDNMPYDQFARELLTASGSNFRVPQVNFFRAIQGRSPEAISAAVSLTLMGTRLDAWPEAKRKSMAAFFSRVSYKATGEWKEEIVYFSPIHTEPLNEIFPDGVKVTIPPDQDPRFVFADWLIRPDNYWFARSIANRVWSWFLGRGIVHEPDDIRRENPPGNPELLSYLEKELIDAKYNLRHLYRLILTSRTYQQSSIPRSTGPDAAALFAYYPLRQLDAEVLIDALCWIGSDGQGYSSPIPEPFTWIPESQRAITLADGSITSSFLEMFGRPARDTGLESERNSQPNDAQRLYLLNSTDIRDKIERSVLLGKLREAAAGNRQQWITLIYATILSRPPTAAELALADALFQKAGANPKPAADDLAWALINTKEFLYRH
jgi:hypothetical protein